MHATWQSFVQLPFFFGSLLFESPPLRSSVSVACVLCATLENLEMTLNFHSRKGKKTMLDDSKAEPTKSFPFPILLNIDCFIFDCCYFRDLIEMNRRYIIMFSDSIIPIALYNRSEIFVMQFALFFHTFNMK